jgi:dCTP diphosphatase
LTRPIATFNVGARRFSLSKMTDTTLHDLTLRLRRFAAERGWNATDTPKNLAVAVLVEAAELQEHFQWLSEEESARLPADKLCSVSLEMADVLIFLLRLADTLGIDAAAAAQRKIAINARKYPTDKARGRATKYTEL